MSRGGMEEELEGKTVSTGEDAPSELDEGFSSSAAILTGCSSQDDDDDMTCRAGSVGLVALTSSSTDLFDLNAFSQVFSDSLTRTRGGERVDCPFEKAAFHFLAD